MDDIDVRPEKPHPHSIFKPATRKPNFAVSVAVNVVRVIVLLIVLAGLAGVGAVLGIAKGYVETAPTRIWRRWTIRRRPLLFMTRIII